LDRKARAARERERQARKARAARERERQARKARADRAREHLRRVEITAAMRGLCALSPEDFERFVGSLFERLGYQVQHTGRRGDGGVDLILTKDGQRSVVQCKRYAPNAKKIGPSVVRDLRGVKARERALHAFLVTTGRFTDGAIKEADMPPRVFLLDAEELYRFIQESDLKAR